MSKRRDKILKRTSRLDRSRLRVDTMSDKRLLEYVASQKDLGTFAYDYATGELFKRTGITPDNTKGATITSKSKVVRQPKKTK